MTPYFDDGEIVIYHGDCNEILASIVDVDIVVTDPPYGMNYQSNHRAKKLKAIEGDSALPVETVQLLIGKAMYATYVFCRWDNLSDMPKPKSFFVWKKNNWTAGDLQHEHGRQWEGICFYPGPKHKFKKRIPDVIEADRIAPARFKDSHPTEKPIGALVPLIDCNEGDIVLDPFMGSGSTLRAAQMLGRRAIGIEIDERYCELAANSLRQRTMF